MIWADSSFLVALYVQAEQTASANRYLASFPEPVAVTTFSRAEAQHAIRLCAFRGTLSIHELAQALGLFERDQSEGFYQAVDLDAGSLFDKATQLSNRYAPSQGTRFLDLLHIAAAVNLKARRFLTFDQRQGKLAKSVGLEVRP